MNNNVLTPFFYTNFGVSVRGKATLEMLALVIPFSETHHKVGHDIVL